MANFGDFVEKTWNDGANPPINAANLNANEDLLELTDNELARSQSFHLNEYLKYFRNRNTKDIELFQDYSTFVNDTPADVDLDEDLSSCIIGNACLECMILDNGADWFGFHKTITALDLTEFYDESASTTDDIIILFLHIDDITAFSGGFIYFNIGNGGVGNTYEYDIDVDAWNLDNGWNVVWMPKSDFFIWAGAPNWNNIDYIQIQVDFNAGHQNDLIVFQMLQMIRQDAVSSGYPNPFQRYMGAASGWENLFTIDYDVVTIVNDIHKKIKKLGIIKLNPAQNEAPFTPGNYPNCMLLYEDINMFVSKWEWHSKIGGGTELPSITWYIDGTHYVEVYVSADILCLDVVNGGAPVQTSWTFDNSLEKNESIIIFFEKQDDTFRVLGFKKGEKLAICEYESSFSSYGSIYLGVDNDDSFGLLTDFSISNSLNQLPIFKDNCPVCVMKSEDETVNNSVAMQNDDELFTNIPPNGTFEVELKLSVDATSNTPDIKLQWSVTGDISTFENISSDRGTLGPGTDATSIENAEYVKLRWRGDITVSNSYGVTSSNYCYIYETFIIKTGEEGGILQLQWAQDVAHASNTIVKAGSYFKVTPVNMQ